MFARPLTSIYRTAVARTIEAIPSLRPKDGEQTPITALDLGTGTGLLAAVLAEHHFVVSGIDICRKMLMEAKRRRADVARFICAPAHCGSMQPGAPFDLVTTAMLMHGLPRAYRRQVLADMTKAAKHGIMIVDYAPPYRLLTGVLERMEHSFYRNFLHEFPEDLSSCCGAFSILPLNRGYALYLVAPSNMVANLSTYDI